MKKLLTAAVALAILAASGFALKAQIVPIPQVTQIGANDLFQDVVNGQPQAQSFYATSAQLGTYGMTLPGSIDGNALIGGDFGTNLWAYTTTPAAVNGTGTYVANRWFAWGGGTSTLTITQQTGATDVAAGSNASFRMNRAGNGLTQVCALQEVETINALRFAGQTAEFDVVSKAGSTFSAANSQAQLYILTGTGTDEGAAKAAFSINAGGGQATGPTGWTGATLLGPFAPVVSTAAFTRASVAAPIASTVKEIAAAVCYTPVGNGASTDWMEFTQAQLVVNPALTSVAGTAGALLNIGDARAKSFNARQQGLETLLQQRYFYTISEPSAGVAVGALGTLSSTTLCDLSIPMPTPMRITPVYRATGAALSASTFEIQTATNIVLAAGASGLTGYFIGGRTGTPTAMNVRATLTSASTAGWACQLQGQGGGAILNFDAELP